MTSYSRLGLVWVHVLQCKTTKDAATIVAAIAERKLQAAHAKSLLPRTDIDAYADPVGGDEDTDSEAPPEVFHVTYVSRCEAFFVCLSFCLASHSLP